jgi:hypothetical protein
VQSPVVGEVEVETPLAVPQAPGYWVLEALQDAILPLFIPQQFQLTEEPAFGKVGLVEGLVPLLQKV